MKKIEFLRLLCAAALCTALCGCADMTDIEKIKSVAAIAVSDSAVTFCTVSVSAQEKTYDYEVYRFETDSIYDGMNMLAERTGKQPSLAHLTAVFFEDGCLQETIKNCVGSVVGGAESHPKAMAAFIDCAAQDFFDGIVVPSDSSMYRLLTDIPDDKFAAVTRCEMIELYYAVNLDDCALLPMFGVNGEGSIVRSGAVCVGTDSAVVTDSAVADAVSLAENGSKPIYCTLSGGRAAVKTASKKIWFDKDTDTAHIRLGMTYNFGRGANMKSAESELEHMIADNLKTALELKNSGFDLLSLRRKAAGEFMTEKGYKKYVNENGGGYFLRNMKYEIETEATEGDL